MLGLEVVGDGVKVGIDEGWPEGEFGEEPSTSGV